MKQTRKLNFVICALSSATLLLSGCQSGFLKKPDFGKLAFWKNDTLRLASHSNDIPPPSSQFAPERGDEGSGSKAEMKASVDQIIANSKRSEKSASVASSDPIRKPYSLDSINPKLDENKTESRTAKSSGNDFVLGNTVNQFQAKTNEVLNSAENAVAKTKQAVQNTENSFVGWKNTLKNSSENQIQNVTGQLKSKVDGAIANTANTINGLAKSTTDSVNQTVSNITESIDNSFQPGGQVVKNPYSSNSTSSKANSMNGSPSKPSAGSDFISKYKTQSQSASMPAIGAASQKNLLQPALTQAGSDIKQSSFDSAIKKSTSSLLQPATSSQSTPPTEYPSTSFGEFRPVKKNKSKAPISSSFEIPRELLQGKSSFSPGSTKPLRPTDTSN